MTEYFLISESLVGAHLVEEQNADEKITTYSMSFPINTKFNTQNKKYENNTSISNMEDFLILIKDYEIAKSKGHTVYFLIGFDGDSQGEYMANILRNELLKHQVGTEQIFRTPFLDDSYITICDFKNIDDFLFYHGINQEFINILKSKKVFATMSIKQALSLYRLVTAPKNKEFEVINNNGTNTFTYITNSLLAKKAR